MHLTIVNNGFTTLPSVAKALEVTKDWPLNSYRIRVINAEKGYCVIDILDEETGEVLGPL